VVSWHKDVLFRSEISHSRRGAASKMTPDAHPKNVEKKQAKKKAPV